MRFIATAVIMLAATAPIAACHHETTAPGGGLPFLQTRCTGDPIRYFAEPLRTRLYALSSRAQADPYRGGKIDDGIKGRLVGDWSYTTLPKTDKSTGPNPAFTANAVGDVR